jgi:hypothetical protein
MSARMDKTWKQMLRLDAEQLRASIHACNEYLMAPDGERMNRREDVVGAAQIEMPEATR